MTDNESEIELQDVPASGEETEGQTVEIDDIVIPDPEPVPDMWATTDMSYRAVLSADDLQAGEILLVGERPVTQDQRADAAQQKAQLLALAAEQIAPLQDAVDLDMATATESAALLAWKKYRVLINRVDVLQAPDIVWPEQPAE